MIVAFDVDGTLLNYNNEPRYFVIELYHWFRMNGDRVIVWSGGGKDYAETVCRRLGLTPDIICGKLDQEAKDAKVDLAIDDEFVKLGKINLKV